MPLSLEPKGPRRWEAWAMALQGTQQICILIKGRKPLGRTGPPQFGNGTNPKQSVREISANGSIYYIQLYFAEGTSLPLQEPLKTL